MDVFVCVYAIQAIKITHTQRNPKTINPFNSKYDPTQAKALLARPHPRETAECLPFVLTELERMRAATTRRAALARSLGVGRFVEGAAELSLELEEEDGEDGEEGGGGGGEGVLEAREGRRGKMGGGGGGLLPHLASTSASQGAGESACAHARPRLLVK